MAKVLKWLDLHFEEVILVFFLVMVTFIVLLQVVMRYIFKAALPWPEELSRYCFVCSTMLSIGYCIRHKAMLRVDILIQLLPKIFQEIIEMAIRFISLALYTYLLYHSFFVVTMSKGSMQLSPAMRLPMYILYISAFVGFGLAVIRTIQDIALAVIKWVKPSQQKKEDYAK